MSELPRYTRAEVSRRNGKTESSVWVIYKDSIYDLTQYIHEHPAGDQEIMEEAGKDATKAFNDACHSKDAMSMLPKYKIGELVEEEKAYDANGKKKKQQKSSDVPEGKNNRSCFNIITCGLIG